MKKQLKQKLEDFLVWALTKVNIQRLKYLTVDDNRIVIGFSDFVKDDGKYHKVSVSASVSFYVKVSPKRKSKGYYNDISVFIDGKKILPKLLGSHKKKTI